MPPPDLDYVQRIIRRTRQNVTGIAPAVSLGWLRKLLRNRPHVAPGGLPRPPRAGPLQRRGRRRRASAPAMGWPRATQHAWRRVAAGESRSEPPGGSGGCTPEGAGTRGWAFPLR